MGTFLSIIIIFVSVLLGVVVLIQNPKGGGLATGFTGVSSIGGVKRTTDFLEKATWSLAIGIFILCLFSTSQLSKSNSANIYDDENAPTEVRNQDLGGVDFDAVEDPVPAE